MRQPKEEARPTDQSRARQAKSKQIVARETVRGRMAEMEATEEGRKELFGWMAFVGFAALFAYMLLDMATGGAL